MTAKDVRELYACNMIDADQMMKAIEVLEIFESTRIEE